MTARQNKAVDPRVEPIVRVVWMLWQISAAYHRRKTGAPNDTPMAMADDIGITALMAARQMASAALDGYGIRFPTMGAQAGANPLYDLQHKDKLSDTQIRNVVIAELAKADAAKTALSPMPRHKTEILP